VKREERQWSPDEHEIKYRRIPDDREEVGCLKKLRVGQFFDKPDGREPQKGDPAIKVSMSSPETAPNPESGGE
jgi:hypothetical protein